MTYTTAQITTATARMQALITALRDVQSPAQQRRVAEMAAALDAGTDGVAAYIDAHPAFATLA